MRGAMGPRNSPQGLSRKPLVISALVAFIAVDILLIALALGFSRDQPSAAELDSSTRPATPVRGDHEAEDDVVTPSSSTGLDPTRAETAPRLLSVSSETVAWRAAGGSCDERGSLELTVDGGETWVATYPNWAGLGRPLWISGADYTAVQSVIASAADCEPDGVRTFNSGASWTEDDQVVVNSALVSPHNKSEVIWGGEPIKGPCPNMTRVAVTGGIASVVCDDGSIWSLPSDSAEWKKTNVRNALALSGSNRRWMAAVESSDCNGLGLVEFDDQLVESLGCVPADLADVTALDFTGNTLWLWVGDQTLVSTDLGRSFN